MRIRVPRLGWRENLANQSVLFRTQLLFEGYHPRRLVRLFDKYLLGLRVGDSPVPCEGVVSASEVM